MLTLLILSCRNDDPTPTPTLEPWHWAEVGGPGGTARGLATLDGRTIAATDAGLLISEDDLAWSALAAEGLPSGTITFVDAIGADTLLVWVHGGGLYRSVDAGARFDAVSQTPIQPLMAAFNPRGAVVPQQTAVSDSGRVWLAGIGGLFYSDDAGDTFTAADTAAAGFNVLFSAVAVQGEQVLAVSGLADSILPSSYQGLLSGVSFYSDDGGQSFTGLDDGLDITAPTGAAFFEGEPCLAAMDGGVLCHDGAGWSSLGGPPDAVGLVHDGDGLLAASATQGLWRFDGADWSGLDVGAVADLEGSSALSVAGTLARVLPGAGTSPPESLDGTVHIALSFHTNLYHSYRGDTNDDDGYGQDLRVMRMVLDWLDAHPDAHAEWDIENHFSLDGWLADEGADVLARISDRVDAGQDDIRLMSWNNGALASSTEEEFAAAVAWGMASNAATFSQTVPGVQPQECMFTPDHIGWYRAQGIDWITLFYAANGFTALRQDVDLSGSALYNPVTLRDEQTDETITWVPAYHHADMLEHGGLSGWARQIRRTNAEDTLLLIHFDADAESWENFGVELDALSEQVASGEVVFTNIQTYLDDHAPVEEVAFRGDVADGTGDGFQSWAEKNFNHELATSIFTARQTADRARVLAEGDGEVEALLAEALVPRMLALSTTHFGLAAPYLHEDRIEAAWQLAAEANETAQAALDLAASLTPLEAGTIEVINTRDSAGFALVEFTLPDADGTTAIFDEDGRELPVVMADGDFSVVLPMAAGETQRLTWQHDHAGPRAEGSLSSDDSLDVLGLSAPMTACDGETSTATVSVGAARLSDRAVRLSATDTADLALCDGAGTFTRERMHFEGLPGTVIAIEAVMGTASSPEDAESVALTPLSCTGTAESITWQTFGGTWRTRPMRAGVDTWNGQSVDGWMSLDCSDGTALQISHRVTERSSLGLAPVREVDGIATIVPLGTLWGSGPWHDARRTGGSGIGEVVTALVGSQYRPAAPDWSGQTITYRLLVGQDIDAGTLDLFAHPPMVRVGGE